MLIDILRWWLVVEALGLCALPLSLWFFRRLPDRGYSFAKPFGLLLTGYGAWLLSMFGLGSFGRWQLIGVALLIAALGLLLLGPGSLTLRLRAVGAELRRQAGWIGFQEALFAVALYVGLWLRWHQFWGFGAGIQITEQPMDLMFLSGILDSQQFPPQDPWFAPYPINYYYLGYLLVAALIRLAGVSVGVGYTLGLATIFALAAISIAGLVRNLIDLSADAADHEAAQPARRWRLGRWLAPLAGVALVLIAGNQVGALQVLAGDSKVVALEPTQLVAAVRNGIGPRASIALPPSFPSGDFNNETQITPTDKIAAFDSWWPSRAVWDDLPSANGVNRVYNITEFPFFSFLLGDLHPHVLSLPWSLLAIAVALNLLLRQSAPDIRTRGGWANLILTAIVIGGLYAINSWDLPAYLLLYLGALTLLYLRLAPTPRAFFWPHFVQQALVTVAACYLVYLPFHLSFTAPTAESPIGVSPVHTGLVEFVIVFGLFFVPLLVYILRTGSAPIAASAGQVSVEPSAAETVEASALAPASQSLPSALWAGLLLAALTLVGVVVGWPLFALLPLAIWAAFAAYAHRERPATAFALWLFAVGALILWGTDVVFLRDNYGSPRMNTIFKFYYQVWLLWGALAAYALWALCQRLRWTAALWLAPTGLLLAGALVYPALAPSRTPPERTLDGLAYLQQSSPDEAAAIDWIRQHTSPGTVIVQAPGKPYQSATARVASATGRPTLIGWTQHEGLWRKGQTQVAPEIDQRQRDVTTLYTTTDPQQAQALLDQYNVRYIYVGQPERDLVAEQAAPPEALTKFDSFMARAFEQNGVIIYERR